MCIVTKLYISYRQIIKMKYNQLHVQEFQHAYMHIQTLAHHSLEKAKQNNNKMTFGTFKFL